MTQSPRAFPLARPQGHALPVSTLGWWHWRLLKHERVLLFAVVRDQSYFSIKFASKINIWQNLI